MAPGWLPPAEEKIMPVKSHHEISWTRGFFYLLSRDYVEYLGALTSNSSWPKCSLEDINVGFMLTELGRKLPIDNLTSLMDINILESRWCKELYMWHRPSADMMRKFWNRIVNQKGNVCPQNGEYWK